MASYDSVVSSKTLTYPQKNDISIVVTIPFLEHFISERIGENFRNA